MKTSTASGPPGPLAYGGAALARLRKVPSCSCPCPMQARLRASHTHGAAGHLAAPKRPDG